VSLSEDQGTQPTPESEERVILSVGGPPSKPIRVIVEIDGKSIPVEFDTGSAVSLILENTQKKCFHQVKLNGTTVVLQTYTTEAMGMLGVM